MQRASLIALMSMTLLSACSGLQVRTAPVILPPVVAPTIDPIALTDVQWRVMTHDDLVALLSKLRNHPNSHFVIYTMDGDNFQALDANLVDMHRYILDQKQVIKFYEKLEAGKIDSKTGAK